MTDSPHQPLNVFLCHSSGDKPAIRDLYQRLQAEGIQPWLDEEDLLPGQDWDREIRKAVRAADVVLVCLSKSSVNKAGFVQKEIKLALDIADEQPEGSIFLIPVKLEECTVPDRLSRWQWVNLFEERGYSGLLRALQARQLADGPEAPGLSNAIRRPLRPQSPIDDLLASRQTLQPPRSKPIEDSTLIRRRITPINASQVQLTGMLRVHANRVWGLCFTPDSQQLASASSDRTVYLWDIANRQRVHIFEGHTEAVLDVAISPDGQTLASASADNTIRLWHIDNGALLHTLKGHAGAVLHIAFSPDSRMLASTSTDATVRLWHVEHASLIDVYSKPMRLVRNVAFAPDGETLATISSDQTVHLWSIGTAAPQRILRGNTLTARIRFAINSKPSRTSSVVFSPDGNILASVSANNTICLWRVRDGSPIKTLPGYSSTVSGLAFLADGQLLASTSDSGTLHLWNVTTGALLRKIDWSDGMYSLAASPDGTLLASAGYTIPIQLWGLE